VQGVVVEREVLVEWRDLVDGSEDSNEKTLGWLDVHINLGQVVVCPGQDGRSYIIMR
jgi:hypothetical protein